ncbi:MAG: RrF2 family transcriptional regulator [Candidatus Omnitrophota bacterium]
MQLLTKNSDYAVRALIILSRQPDSFMTARKISEEARIPYEYLRKILQKMMKAGLLESHEGGRGGFRLARSADTIAVSDVMEIFQGQIELSQCMFRQKLCHNRPTCALRKNIMRIQDMVQHEFDNITIATLLGEVGGSYETQDHKNR